MDADVQERPHLGRLMVLNPLRRFLLAALLWLPFAFFVWFYFAAPLVWPVIALVRFVLLTAWPQLFTAVSQGADLLDAQGRLLEHLPYLMQLSTSVMVDVAEPGAAPRFGLIEPTVNPMVMLRLPLFAGLVLATPVSLRQRRRSLRRHSADLDRAGFGVIARAARASSSMPARSERRRQGGPAYRSI
jgi:hypothetical protein